MSGYWLSQVPSGWHLLPLRRVTELKNIRVNGTSRDEGYIGLENIEPWTGRLLKSDVVYLEDDDEKSGVVASFDAGDVLFGKLRPYLAKAHLAQENGICTTELLVLKPQKQMDARFLLRIILTNEFINQVNTETFGARMPRADWNTIGNLLVPLPPLPQQHAIADYLDRETARLDALIAAKERLLELLAEKRRAVITHAVTRGLNPDVPLRDSGVEWLGEIPSHWEVTRLKNVSQSLQTGPFGSQLHAEDYIDNGIPSINPAHLRDGKIFPNNKVTVDEATVERLSIHKLHKGDVVLARRGEIGRCGLVTDSEVGWLCGSGSLRVRPNQGQVNSQYLVLLLTNTFVGATLSMMSVGTTMDNLNTEIVGNLILPLPPINEQNEIVSKLDAITKKNDTLKSAAQKTIDLLRERRAAIIAAAVSGQIEIKG